MGSGPGDPTYNPSLAEALDQPSWQFATSGDAVWRGWPSSGYEGGDVAFCQWQEQGQVAYLETVQTFEGGYLSFWWAGLFRGRTGRFRFFMDDMATPLAVYEGTEWRNEVFQVPAGTHLLRWAVEGGDGPTNIALLDKVVHSTEGPAVAMQLARRPIPEAATREPLAVRFRLSAPASVMVASSRFVVTRPSICVSSPFWKKERVAGGERWVEARHGDSEAEARWDQRSDGA